MRKLMLLSVLAIGILSVSSHYGSSKQQVAAVVGPGPDAVITNVIDYKESSKVSNLLAADPGPGPTFIANNIG